MIWCGVLDVVVAFAIPIQFGVCNGFNFCESEN